MLLAVGELSHIEDEQLRFCYEAITTETPLEGSRLEIEKIDAMVKCPHCSYRGRPKYWDGALSGIPVATLECPSCGKTTQPTDGQECAIKSVRFTEADPASLMIEIRMRKPESMTNDKDQSRGLHYSSFVIVSDFVIRALSFS